MKLRAYLQKRNASELARELKITPVLVSQWSTGVRRIPAERCIEIEKVTGGAVRCEHMRPDIDWAVIRGPARAAEIKAA